MSTGDRIVPHIIDPQPVEGLPGAPIGATPVPLHAAPPPAPTDPRDAMLIEVLRAQVEGITRSAEIAHSVGQVLQEAEAQAGEGLKQVTEILKDSVGAMNSQTEQIRELNRNLVGLTAKMEAHQEITVSGMTAKEAAAKRRAALIKQFLGDKPLDTIFKIIVVLMGGTSVGRVLWDSYVGSGGGPPVP